MTNKKQNRFEAVNMGLSALSDKELQRAAGGYDYDMEYEKEGKEIEDIFEPGEYIAV